VALYINNKKNIPCLFIFTYLSTIFFVVLLFLKIKNSKKIYSKFRQKNLISRYKNMSKTAMFSVDELLKQQGSQQELATVEPLLISQQPNQHADLMKIVAETNKHANMNTNLNSFMMKNFYVKLIGDNTNPQLNLEKSSQDENGMTHLNKKLENFMSDLSWLKQAQQMNPVPPPMNHPAFPSFPQMPSSAAFLSPFFFNNMNSQMLQQRQQQQALAAATSSLPNLSIINELNKAAAQPNKEESKSSHVVGGKFRKESATGGSEMSGGDMDEEELKSSDYEDDNDDGGGGGGGGGGVEFGNEDGLDSHYGSGGENDYDDENNDSAEESKPNGSGSKKRKRRILFTKHQTYELEKRFRQQR
jgi:hypothetical protein